MKTIVKILYTLELNNINDNKAFKDLIAGCFYLGISNKEIASECDVSYTTVNRWENGVSSPHPAIRGHLFKQLKPRVFALVSQSLVEQKGADGVTVAQSPD